MGFLLNEIRIRVQIDALKKKITPRNNRISLFNFFFFFSIFEEFIVAIIFKQNIKNVAIIKILSFYYLLKI